MTGSEAVGVVRLRWGTPPPARPARDLRPAQKARHRCAGPFSHGCAAAAFAALSCPHPAQKASRPVAKPVRRWWQVRRSSAP